MGLNKNKLDILQLLEDIRQEKRDFIQEHVEGYTSFGRSVQDLEDLLNIWHIEILEALILGEDDRADKIRMGWRINEY